MAPRDDQRATLVGVVTENGPNLALVIRFEHMGEERFWALAR